MSARPLTELIFRVEDAPEEGFIGRALGTSILTERETMDELRSAVREAVACHFDEAAVPSVIRLHYVSEEILIP